MVLRIGITSCYIIISVIVIAQFTFYIYIQFSSKFISVYLRNNSGGRYFLILFHFFRVFFTYKEFQFSARIQQIVHRSIGEMNFRELPSNLETWQCSSLNSLNQITMPRSAIISYPKVTKVEVI